MVLTVQEFKDLYNIELADNKIEDAINNAKASLYNLISIKKEWIIQDKQEIENISLNKYYPINKNLDYNISNTDLTFFEFDSDYNVVDRETNISNIKFVDMKNNNRLLLTFNTQLPVNSNSQLQLSLRVTQLQLNNPSKIEQIKKWLGLKAFNLLGSNIIMMLNQNGITDWNLNGVSVRADNSGLQELKQNNEQEMREIYDEMMPIVVKRTFTRNRWLGGRYRNL